MEVDCYQSLEEQAAVKSVMEEFWSSESGDVSPDEVAYADQD